ncbi:hypothetical protein RJT34_09959 [Clitoria ternatea]|uniref:Uncharacterized protein n=1 Tax=Clitoria ternatea TaxID=43366 RepID=A0AAN9PWS3_CLITE
MLGRVGLIACASSSTRKSSGIKDNLPCHNSNEDAEKKKGSLPCAVFTSPTVTVTYHSQETNIEEEEEDKGFLFPQVSHFFFPTLSFFPLNS